MSTCMDYLLFIMAMATLWLTGAAVQRRGHPFDAFAALAVGAWVVSMFMLGWVTLGAMPPRGGLLALPVIAWGARLALGGAPFRRNGERPTRPRAVTVILILIWAVITLWLAWITLATSMYSLAGIGIWGFKAKLFFLSGGIPDGFWTDAVFCHAQPTYPLGFPLVALWCYVWLGGVNDHVVQLLPVLFLSASILLMIRESLGRGRWGWAAGALALALYLSPQCWDTAKLFYAEPMMLFLLLIGLKRLDEDPDGWTGWLLLAAAAWVKNEGALVILAAVFSHGVVALRKRRLVRGAPWAAPVTALALAAIWPVFVSMKGASLPDFGWDGMAQARHGLVAAADGFREMALRDGHAYAWLWLIAPVLLVMRRRVLGTRDWFLLIFALVFTAASLGLYAFSRSSELAWHVSTSLNRLLLVPTLAWWWLILRVVGDEQGASDNSVTG